VTFSLFPSQGPILRTPSPFLLPSPTPFFFRSSPYLFFILDVHLARLRVTVFMQSFFDPRSNQFSFFLRVRDGNVPFSPSQGFFF